MNRASSCACVAGVLGEASERGAADLDAGRHLRLGADLDAQIDRCRW
jgi:hypothetical protein